MPFSRREFLKLGAAASATAFLAACAPTVEPRSQETPSPKDPLNTLLDSPLLPKDLAPTEENIEIIRSKIVNVVDKALPRLRNIDPTIKEVGQMTEEERQKYVEEKVIGVKLNTLSIVLEGTGWQINPEVRNSGMGSKFKGFNPEITKDWLEKATGLDALEFYLGASLSRDLPIGSQFDETLLDDNGSYKENDTLAPGLSVYNLKTYDKIRSLNDAAITLLALVVRHQTDGQ